MCTYRRDLAVALTNTALSATTAHIHSGHPGDLSMATVVVVVVVVVVVAAVAVGVKHTTRTICGQSRDDSNIYLLGDTIAMCCNTLRAVCLEVNTLSCIEISPLEQAVKRGEVRVFGPRRTIFLRPPVLQVARGKSVAFSPTIPTSLCERLPHTPRDPERQLIFYR